MISLPHGSKNGAGNATEGANSGVRFRSLGVHCQPSPKGYASGGSAPLLIVSSTVYFNWARGANPERKPQERREMRRKRLILSPPLRFPLRLSFLIPPLSCSALSLSLSAPLCAPSIVFAMTRKCQRGIKGVRGTGKRGLGGEKCQTGSVLGGLGECERSEFPPVPLGCHPRSVGRNDLIFSNDAGWERQ